MFQIKNNSVIRHHHIPQFHSSPTNHHRQRTMPPAANLLLYNDSLQSDSLGDACLIAILASVTMLLRFIEAYLMKTKKE